MSKTTRSHIIYFPNPILRKITEPVTFDNTAINLANKLSLFLPHSGGFAVAAPQLGISKQAFAYKAEHFRGILFNPRILEYSDELWEYPEGCLSIPGKYYTVKRPRIIKVMGYSAFGEEKNFELTDLRARIFQHEIDHLNSRLVVDLAKEQNAHS